MLDQLHAVADRDPARPLDPRVEAEPASEAAAEVPEDPRVVLEGIGVDAREGPFPPPLGQSLLAPDDDALKEGADVAASRRHETDGYGGDDPTEAPTRRPPRPSFRELLPAPAGVCQIARSRTRRTSTVPARTRSIPATGAADQRYPSNAVDASIAMRGITAAV